MAPEVISLLSSPLGTSPVDKIPTKSPPAPTREPKAPSRLLDFDDDPFLDISGAKTSTTTSKVRAPILKEAPVRACGTESRDDRRRKDDNNFLFLSDDFDTTGDLSFLGPTKPQASPGPTRDQGAVGRSMTRMTSAGVATKTSGPLQASGMKRWNAIADPIQHTSSPRGLDLDDDPFASSPPPRRPSKGKAVERSGPANDAPVAGKTRPAPSTNVFDLTSDFSDLSPVQSKSKISKRKADWDPISSSMPEMSRARSGDDAFASSPPKPSKRKVEVIELDDSDVHSSEDEFPELAKVRVDDSLLSRANNESTRTLKRSKTAPVGVTATKPPPKTQEEKDLEKKQKAEARFAENERKRIEKEREKKEKAIQKEKDKALAQVNKVRVNKSVAQIEMIVDLPDSMAPGISAQVEKLLEELKVDCKTWNSPVDHVVRWRRKVDKRYNEEKDFFEPIPLRLEQEKHALVVIQAADFVKLATAGEGIDVAAHVLKMKDHFPDSSVIYVLEGLDQWFRKNKTARNRQFQTAARNDAAPASSQARRRSTAHEIIDEDIVEDALLSLQVDHGVLIHKTNATIETAQWITVFTQHISTIPYRKLRDEVSADAGFSVESGQVKTGETIKETYILMLQEVARVTAPMAYGIAAEYPTVTALVRGLEQNGPLALEDLRKSANRDGRLTDQRIGQAISKRLYKIFTCKDPTSTEV